MTRFLSALFFLLTFNYTVGQSINQLNAFLKGEGAELISRLAHPSNTFKSANWKNYEDGSLILKIVSTDSFFGGDVITQVSLSRQGYFFTDLKVHTDTDLVPPFVAVAFLKELLNEHLRNYNSEQGQMLSSFEKFFNTSLVKMNAFQVSLILLSLDFLDSV